MKYIKAYRFNKIITLASIVALAIFVACVCIGCNKQTSNFDNSLKDGTVRVESMYGPTTVGLTEMINSNDGSYSFKQVKGPDSIIADLESGSVDIACIPVNLAANLYNKTDSLIQMIDVNTLSAISMISPDPLVTDISSMSGNAIHIVGKGSIPDAVTQILLAKNGIVPTASQVEYRGEAIDVFELFEVNPTAVGVVNEPQSTIGMVSKPKVKQVCDVQTEWQKYFNSQIVTGVTVARTDFIKDNPDAIKKFLSDHKQSIETMNENPQKANDAMKLLGLSASSDKAREAVEKCNISFAEGKNAHKMTESFLSTILENKPEFLPNGLPNSGFYYNG